LIRRAIIASCFDPRRLARLPPSMSPTHAVDVARTHPQSPDPLMNAKLVLKILGLALGSVVLLGAGFYGWASMASGSKLAAVYETHSASFPIPFPLTESELVELGIESDPGDGIALERALERGEHLINARYGCRECHGQTFAGGVMVDAFPIGTLLGPNITLGEGSKTAAYTARDWDRIVRHGVKPDGTPATMPSVDFQLMSDQELSDVVAFIRSQPPMFAEVPAPTLGPLGTVLIATGQIPLSAAQIPSHQVQHESFPPAALVSVEFGRHLSGVCVGCHGQAFAGGPIPGGDPSWAPAANLTPHADGLAGWTLEQFRTALTAGTRPDGTALLPPMTLILPAGQNMTDVEMEALWAYLQSLPPTPTPG
jgi:cytochrome c553